MAKTTDTEVITDDLPEETTELVAVPRKEPYVPEMSAEGVPVYDTKELQGLRVVMPKNSKKDPDATKRVGKVRNFVFAPKGRRCVGFLVKRPDVALMFHRKDMFVGVNGFDIVDGRIVVRDADDATDKGACKALGINLDECVLWIGLPVMCDDGTNFGLVGSVEFNGDTGEVLTLVVDGGMTANALLGTRHIPASEIKGFRFGMGAALNQYEVDDEEDIIRGAILVKDSAKEIEAEGGLADAAGAATAVVVDKAKNAWESSKQPMAEAAHAAGEAATKGAYATGRQIKAASGMFSAFKEEYDKAAAPDEPAALPAEQVEYVYMDEDGNEVEYVDEDGNPIEFVDEDGNPVHPDGSPIEAPRPRPAAKKPTAKSASGGAAKAVGSHLKKAGGMFSAFKEEYDKARHE